MPSAIGLALFALGAPLAVVNVVTLVVVPAIIKVAISVGLQLAASYLSRNSSPLPKPSDGQTEVKQALSPRVRSYGRVRVSGAVWWLDAINKVLYLGIALNHGRIGAYVDFLIDENTVDIDGTDQVTTSPYDSPAVFLHNRLGLPTETKYSEILSGFGVDEVRGDGVATILGTFTNPNSAATFQNTYPNGRPLIRATIEASVVWDPRDATQDRTDPSTYLWSDNPVVCLLDYMLSADGYGIPWERIEPNLDEWIAAADVCDEPVDLLAGGTTFRYRIAGTYTLEDDPKDVVAKFLSVCDGKVWPKRDGSIGINVGKFATPTVTIGNDAILAYTDLMFGQDPATAIEGIRAEYMSPEHDYREHEAEPWPTGDAVLELSDDRTAALDLLWVPGLSQARRLMKRAFMRAQARWRGTILTNLAGLRALDERYITVVIDELSINETFEIGQFTLDPNGLTCEIEILSVDATIDDWDPSEEGTEEGGGFAVDSITFTKTGTAVDVLVEAGGAAGLTAFVGCANGTGIAATPAGWTLIAKAGPTSSLAIGLFMKLLDGTETSATFGSASGAIMVALVGGMSAPAISGSRDGSSVSTGSGIGATLTSPAAPFLALAVAAANSDFDQPGWLEMNDVSSKATIVQDSNVLRTGSITMQLAYALYASDAVPPSGFDFAIASDKGTNGIAYGVFTPG